MDIIGRIGEGLQISAIASDGTIEAVEGIYDPFCMGIQFHPEYLKVSPSNEPDFLTVSEIEDQTNIFSAMVKVARQYANKKTINLTLFPKSTPLDETALNLQRSLTVGLLGRKFKPGGSQPWCGTIQNLIDKTADVGSCVAFPQVS